MNATFFASVRTSLFGGSMRQPQVDGIETIFEAWDRSGDKDDAKLAYLLATAFHETARVMQPIHERGAKAYFNKYEPGTKIGKALGNTVEGDGYKFRGRGFVQLTGRANYRKAGEKMSVELLGSPDRALEPHIAAMALIRGSLEGWYTGKRLDSYINSGVPGDGVDYVNARRVINGTDKAELIAGYASHFERAIAAARKVKPAPVTPPKPATDHIPDAGKKVDPNSAGWIVLGATAVSGALIAAWDWIVAVTGYVSPWW